MANYNDKLLFGVHWYQDDEERPHNTYRPWWEGCDDEDVDPGDGQADGQEDGQADGQEDGQADGQEDGQEDGQADGEADGEPHTVIV